MPARIRSIALVVSALAAFFGLAALATAAGGAQARSSLHVARHPQGRHRRHARRSVRRRPIAHLAGKRSRSLRARHGVTRSHVNQPTPPPTPTPTPGALTFGIYPGGASGSVGASGPLKPEIPAARLAALQQLRAPGAPFVLHLYAGYNGPGSWTVAQEIGDQITTDTAAGFQVEITLCYRPADGGSAADVSDFARYAAATVSQYGANPNVVSLQVTNEANVAGAPNASDGYYAGAKDALIQGVIAAHSAAVTGGFTQVKVGFNWANASDPGETGFWSYLGQHGGSAFANAVDWVGLDAYPGTWGPSMTGTLAAGTTSALTTAFSALRNRYMPLAGLGPRVALHVSESGYPTGPGRTPAMQAQALQAAVTAVIDDQAAYNITDYRWFDLRDANSSSTSFEDQYGLMTDTYQPKPAFSAYQNLIAQYR